ncbi:ABC-type transporter ATP-binding protein EcsA [Rubripirellula obstinata]|uniref:ABC-type transporter ATP-binding protein EcsA n=2 Tax=Rubripirellula obstinata TaxID=406547 RepID=A0A5B1CJ33_9BACT|nr:ABC transporter ATP-binding protein [Rubripirellula obstinata]KAA1259294.1 ABC-type transporter ATP-binding protein EcsA [Rubripirellula obstinata]
MIESAMTEATMIEVNGLRKLYDDYLAVDGVSFSLRSGSVCGLVGANGAGKTTTMRCLAGLMPATDGKMTVAGHAVSTDSIELKKCLAYVPDDPPLFDDLSVREHLHFIGRIYRVEGYVEKSQALITQFDLIAKADAGATTLSRGMRQKLAIACAYLYDPSVLLLDEPMTGLDPPGIRILLDSIRQRAAKGATVILSSHLLPMIEEVCTDLMMMRQGVVDYFGNVSDLRNRHPESTSLESAYFAATQLHEQANPSQAVGVLA